MLPFAPDAEACTIDAGTAPDAVLERIEQHGTVLCKGAIDPVELAPLRDNAERFFGYVEYCLLNKLEIPQLATYNATALRMAANLLCLNPRPEPARLTAVSLIRRSYVYPILKAYLGGEKALFLFQNSRVRRVYPETHVLSKHVKSLFPYHQDGIPVGNSTETILCWLPLDACGRTAPGLEIALKRLKRLIPLAQEDSSPFRDFEIAAADVEAALEETPRWQPEYEPGDLQLIPCTTLHRSTSHVAMYRPSVAAELRFAPDRIADQFEAEQSKILV